MGFSIVKKKFKNMTKKTQSCFCCTFRLNILLEIKSKHTHIYMYMYAFDGRIYNDILFVNS